MDMQELLNKDTSDSVVRFLFDRHGVRGEICQLKGSVQELLAEHHYPDSIKLLLLDLAAAAVLVSATLKADAQIMVQIQGGSGSKAIRYALININEDLSFYGSALLQDGGTYSDSQSFKETVGEGASLIISVFPKDGNKWQGIVPLDGNSTAQALESYFKNSEQLPTRFFICSDPKTLSCGGLMLQIIPETEGNEESLEHLSVLASTLKSEEIQNLPLYEVLRRLYWNDEVRAVKEQQVHFKCVCSKERCERALTSLPHRELAELAADPRGTSMTCQHCGRSYQFSQAELQSLLHKVSQ